MALTDADRIQMTAMALMRYSVVTTGGGSVETYYPCVPNIICIPAENVDYSKSYEIFSADITSGQTFSAYSGTAANAFDDSTGTYWQSGGITTNEYIQVQLSTAKVVKALTIYNYSGRGIKDFLLLASNNGSDWTQLYSGVADFSSKSMFVFDNDAAYAYYRVKNNGTPYYSSYIRIYEIELFEFVFGG